MSTTYAWFLITIILFGNIVPCEAQLPSWLNTFLSGFSFFGLPTALAIELLKRLYGYLTRTTTTTPTTPTSTTTTTSKRESPVTTTATTAQASTTTTVPIMTSTTTTTQSAVQRSTSTIPSAISSNTTSPIVQPMVPAITSTTQQHPAESVTPSVITVTVPVVPSGRIPWPPAHCDSPFLTDQLRQTFLDMHNQLRGSLSRGQTEKSNGWGIAPPAAVMHRMKYNCDCESYSIQHAKTCNGKRFPDYALFGYQENVYVLRNPSATLLDAARQAMTEWWSELAKYGMRSNMLFGESEFTRNNRVTSWSRMAWTTNIYVGCAVKHCGNFIFVVCTYTGGGNYPGHHVYKVGAVCSECPPGYCDDQSLCRW